MPRTYKAKHARVKEARKDNLTAAIDMVNSKQLTIAQPAVLRYLPMLKSWRLL